MPGSMQRFAGHVANYPSCSAGAALPELNKGTECHRIQVDVSAFAVLAPPNMALIAPRALTTAA